MNVSFSIREVYEIAIQIEKNGATFYRKAATLLSDRDVRETLLDLAAQEEGHEEIFKGMRLALREAAHEQWEYFDPQALTYLRALAGSHVFDVTADISGELCESMSPGEILMMAVGKERDSILFFLGLRELAFTPVDRDRIEGVIKEETGHVTLLLDRIEQLGGV